jgi:hypothetical protein
MRAIIVTAVLGLGTALVFGAAALTATLFPNGTMVASGWSGGWMTREAIPVPAPAVQIMPMVIGDSGNAVDGSGGIVVAPDFKALPGDTTGGGAWTETPAPVPAP